MNRLSITVPQLGEGILEVRIVALLVAPQQYVNRDDAIAEVETDKANLVIESPFDGVVEEILCRPGDRVQVGSNLAWVQSGGRLEATPVEDGIRAAPPDDSGNPVSPVHGDRPRNGTLSPRQQAALRRTGGPAAPMTAAADPFEGLLSPRQRMLAQRFKESHLAMAPASIEMALDWSAIEERRRRCDTREPPTGLELLAWAAAAAMAEHPRFRIQRRLGAASVILPHVELGIAVALPDDDLTTARITQDGSLSFAEFIAAMRAAIAKARSEGAGGNASLVISDLSSYGVLGAAPAVVAPSVATLFLGYPDWKPERGIDGELEWRRIARLVLAFDHCVVNGAGASNFLRAVIDHAVGAQA